MNDQRTIDHRMIELDAANSVLIKVNQIGTITEALGTINLALEHDMTAIISHRSGETELPFESDFSVGTAPARYDPDAKKVRKKQAASP